MSYHAALTPFKVFSSELQTSEGGYVLSGGEDVYDVATQMARACGATRVDPSLVLNATQRLAEVGFYALNSTVSNLNDHAVCLTDALKSLVTAIGPREEKSTSLNPLFLLGGLFVLAVMFYCCSQRVQHRTPPPEVDQTDQPETEDNASVGTTASTTSSVSVENPVPPHPEEV
jgi:hypothetical protein